MATEQNAGHTSRPGMEAVLANRTLFVLGTDTEVGKTVISVTLGRLWWGRSQEVCAVKAVAAGGERHQQGHFIAEDSQALSSAMTEVGAEVFEKTLGVPRISPLLGYTNPIAPYTSSLIDGTPIDVAYIRNRLREVEAACHARQVRLIIEGAGGVLVPLSPRETLADLVAELGMPAVVVARTELGTINHTLLALEALQNRRIALAGVILSRRKTGPYTLTEKAGFRELDLFIPGTVPFLLAGCSTGAPPEIIPVPVDAL